MQSTVSVLMAAIVFIVEFFSGILSSASDRDRKTTRLNSSHAT